MAFARALKALKRAEEYYIGQQEYDPVDAVEMIYDRAVNYWDQVFPNDEHGFRATLVKKREDRLKWAYKQRAREQKENTDS